MDDHGLGMRQDPPAQFPTVPDCRSQLNAIRVGAQLHIIGQRGLS